MAGSRLRSSGKNGRHIIVIEHEAIEGAGEDSFAYRYGGGMGMIAVFDGCGGLGSRRYVRDESHTGAYIASRIAALSTLDWLDRMDEIPGCLDEQVLIDSLKSKLDRSMGNARRYLEREQRTVYGSMVRTLPTTASIVLIDEQLSRGETELCFVWAGDSRGYVLTPRGIVQWTQDDLRVQEDAFENLYGDSPLSNMIHAGGDYRLSLLHCSYREPVIVLAATDGAFGYLPSPMHFELLLLDTMADSADYEEWRRRMAEALTEITGDDCTLVAAVLGWQDHTCMKRAFAARRRELEELLRDVTEVQALRELWSMYKAGYYGKRKYG